MRRPRCFFLLLGSLFSRKGTHEIRNTPPARRMVLLIIVATLPLFGILPVKDYIESAMNNVTFVSAALIATGFILFFSDRMARGRKTARTATMTDASGGLRAGLWNFARYLPVGQYHLGRAAARV